MGRSAPVMAALTALVLGLGAAPAAAGFSGAPATVYRHEGDVQLQRAALYASMLSASCALKLSAIDAGVASVAKLRPSDNKDAFFTAAPRLVTAVVVVLQRWWW